jgi:large subunit ribosomal protein L22
MGQVKKERRLSGTEAQAKLKTLRTSPRKLNLVAQSIAACRSSGR